LGLDLATIFASVFVAVIGFGLGNYTRRKPHLYTRCLVIGLLSTTPLMIGLFTWYDEIFLGFFLLSNMPKSFRGKNKFHFMLFVLFIAYMVGECFHGMIVLESIRKIRWPIFFLILLLLLYKINSKKEESMIDEGLAFAITVFGLLFSVVFLGYGIVTEALGVYRQDIQAAMLGYGWSNFRWAIWAHFSYTTFIFIVTLPAVFMTLYDKKPKRRQVAWITLILLFIVAYYYDVRIAAIYLIGSLLLIIPRLGVAKVVIIILLLVSIFAIDTQLRQSKERGLKFFFKDLSQTGGSIWSKDTYDPISSRDLDRKVWFLSIFPALTDNWLNLFFGYGFRRAGYVIAPHVYNLLIHYGKKGSSADTIGSEAITNIAVDTGIIGIVLFLALFVIVGRTVYLNKGKFRWLFVFSILSTFAWLFVTNIIDIVIFYYILMPSGIFVQLARLSVSRTNKQTVRYAYPNNDKKPLLR